LSAPSQREPEVPSALEFMDLQQVKREIEQVLSSRRS